MNYTFYIYKKMLQKNNQMTELNLFLRFNAPSNEGNSAYSKARSMPDFLNPKDSIFLLALISLSCVVLQDKQFHVLSDNFNLSFLMPQIEHILLLGSNLPIYSSFLPFHIDLYLSIFSNAFQLQSLIAPASLWFLIIPFIFKSSSIIKSKRLVISFETLFKKSFRWFVIFSCCFAMRNFQTFLRLLFFCFLQSCRCIHFNFTCALRKYLGFVYSVPSEQTANVLIPKSMPTAFIGFNISTYCLLFSTKILMKYLSVEVLLIVTVFISPINFLCKTAFIGFLNFGKKITLFLKSTLMPCGNWNDCLLFFLLKLGYNALPLKNLWNELSKFLNAICKHWLCTSFNHVQFFFKSVSCADSVLYDNCTLLPKYAVCLVSNAKLYTNLTESKCFDNNTPCSVDGYIRYLNDFNTTQRYIIYTNNGVFYKNIINFIK